MAQHRVLLAFPFLYLSIVLGAYGQPAGGKTSDPGNAGQQFADEVLKLKQDFAKLSGTIDEGANTIDTLSNPEKARNQLADLKEAVSTLLSAVTDNSTVANLGAKALKRARDKLNDLSHDPRFSTEANSYLAEEWRKKEAETRQAVDELEEARKQFAQFLLSLQTNQDFLDELSQLQQADIALGVLRQLTKDIRSTSDNLKRIMGGISAPGA